MSNTTIQIKYSTSTGSTPSSLELGELAINAFDGKIFYANTTGSIKWIQSFSGPSGLNTELQFNDSGVLGASSNLTFDKTTATFTTRNVYAVDSIRVGNVLYDATNSAGVNGYVLTSNGTSAIWTQLSVSSATATEDTSTAALYPVMVAAVGSAQSLKATSTTNKLQFNASDGTLTTTHFNTVSDIRKKENVQDIQNALETVSKLRGVSYTLKDNKQKSIGVVAQEIEKVLPEVVSQNDVGDLAVAYGNIVGLLIEAIKDLKQEIEELKSSKRK